MKNDLSFDISYGEIETMYHQNLHQWQPSQNGQED